MPTAAPNPPPTALAEGQDRSQTDVAYERLREAIINLVLAPGAMYSEAQLAEFAGFGRTPVREALQRLIHEELVVIRRNRGIQITPIDIIRQLQLLEVRRVLELLLVERAVTQATEPERREMLRLAELTESLIGSGDQGSRERNRQVMDLKARASHNQILDSTLGLFYGLSRRFWVTYAPRIPGCHDTADRLHARILRGIALGDRQAASQATQDLMDFLESFTRQAIELK